jgi:drug/metabolite transporter (DMT)-like permease
MEGVRSSRSPGRTSAIGLLLLTILFWGISFVSTKTALRSFPPMTLAFLRFAIASALLFPIKRRLAPRDRLARTDVPKVAMGGFSGVALYFLCENYGIKLTTASESALIVASIPTMTLLAESRLSHSRILRSQWIGSLLSFVGVAIIVAGGMKVSGSLGGYLCMLGADGSWVAYTLLTGSLFVRYNRVAVVYWQTLFGLLSLLPLLCIDVAQTSVPDWVSLAHLTFLGVACSALGYWFYARALQAIGVAAASVYINLIPVVAVAVGVAFGDQLGLLQLAGGGMVVFGVFVATRTCASPESDPRPLICQRW